MAHPHQLVRTAFPGMFPVIPQPDPGPLGAFFSKLQVNEDGTLRPLTEEDIRSIQADEVDLQITLVPVSKLLLDRNGNAIKPRKLAAAVGPANPAYHIIRPEALDWAAGLDRLRFAFEFKAVLPSAAEFQERCEQARLAIRNSDDERIRFLDNGICLPGILPKTKFPADVGQTVQWLVNALKRSYEAQFSGRTFTNYRDGELSKQVTIVAESREQHLFASMGTGPVFFNFYPCFQGWSPNAEREFMGYTPEQLMLAGLSLIGAQIMWPDVMLRDEHTPLWDCSSLQWRSAEYSLYSGAYGDGARFRHRAGLGGAGGGYCGGLSVVG